MNHRIKSILLCFLVLLTGLVRSAELALADVLVEAGQRAILSVSITVDGAVEKPQGHRDEVVKWSTKRAFEAKVEMVAGKAEKMSVSDNFSGSGGSTKAALDDVQKQATACGEDKLCQMRLAMQMMNNPVLSGATDGPKRYQTWRPVGKSGRIEASGSHTEMLHTVFYTAARETTDCNMTAPKVSPELTQMDPTSGEKWAAINKETLENGARLFTVEVDGVDKIGMLNLNSTLSVGSGNIECVQNIGSGPETSQHSRAELLLPTDEIRFPLRVPGAVTGNDVLASGSSSFKSIQKLNNLGVGFAVDVAAPLDVTIRWELRG